MTDGSIRIKVKIDNDVAEKDLASLNKSIDRTAQNIEKAMSKLSDNPTAGLSKSGDVLSQIDQQAATATSTIAEMRAKLAEVGNQTVQSEQLESVYNEIAKADKKMEELIARQNKMDAMGVKDTSKQYKSLQYEIDATAEKLDKLRAREEDLISRGVGNVRIGDTQEFADKVAQVDALEAKQQSLNEKTDEYRAKVKAVGDAKNAGFKGFDGLIDKLGNSFSGLTKKVIKYGAALLGARGAMGILRKAVNSYMQANTETKEAVTSAWATIGEMLGPIIEWLVGILTTAISWINMFVYALTGINFAARANAKALNKQAAATNNAAKAQRQLAGFDEQNRLGDNVSESGGGAGGAGGFQMDDTIKDGIEEQIAKISAIVGAASLALGAILTFTGVNIPLGIALMAIGALEIAAAHKIAWDSMNEDVRRSVSQIEQIVAGAALGIGAILAFTGINVPLGIALMAVGAAALVASIALDWDKTSNKVEKVINTIMTVLGGAMLVIGVLLVFTTASVALGLGLIVAGAATLAGAIAPNWDGISAKTAKTLETISAIAGAALLVLGIILLFTGAGIPLGLGMIVAGGASLASAIVPNWDSITEKVGTAIDNAKKNLKEKWDNFIGIFKFDGGGDSGFSDIAEDIKSAFGNLPDLLNFDGSGWDDLKSNFREKFKGLKDTAVAFLDGSDSDYSIANHFKNLPSKLKLSGFTDFKTGFKEKFKGLKESALKYIDDNDSTYSIRTHFKNLPSKLSLSGWDTIKKKLKSKFKDMGSSVASAISGAFKSILNSVISKAESKINSAISVINKAISIINKIPGVSVSKISTVSFPRLAKGGIVNNPGRGVPAIVGEAGAEAVLPLERNTGWMDILADKISAKGGAGTVVIPIYLSGKKIAEEVIDLNRKREFALNGGIA